MPHSSSNDELSVATMTNQGSNAGKNRKAFATECIYIMI